MPAICYCMRVDQRTLNATTPMRVMPRIAPVVAAAVIVACSPRADVDPAAKSPAVTTAAQALTTDGLLQHIKDLSADSMEGRGPGTPGEDKAVAYMQGQFKALGLKPGNPDGTYIQNVDLVGYTAGLVERTLCK